MLYERINDALEIGREYTLNEVCEVVGSKSKSYVKMTLFAMPNIEAERRFIACPINNHPSVNNWYWVFRLVL